MGMKMVQQQEIRQVQQTSMRMRIRQEELRSPFLSCFPKAEKWLHTNADAVPHLIRYLKCVTRRKRFRTDMDFFVVYFAPELAPTCAAYYQGRGPKLIEFTGSKFRRQVDMYLVIKLKELYQKT